MSDHASSGPSICEDCPRLHPKKHPNPARSVPVSMVFGGVCRCPKHTLMAIAGKNMTLDQAMGCEHGEEPI